MEVLGPTSASEQAKCLRRCSNLSMSGGLEAPLPEVLAPRPGASASQQASRSGSFKICMHQFGSLGIGLDHSVEVHPLLAVPPPSA